MKMWTATIYCMVSLATIALSQTATSPRSSSEELSLPASLRFIQDNINAQGEIRYTMISKSTVDGHTVEDHYMVETLHAIADPRSCTMQLDASMTLNGRVQRKGRVAIQFRDITTLSVKSQTNAIEEQTARAGVTEWTGKIMPESYLIQTFHNGSLSGILFFRERFTADNVAKAIRRVVEQCGGVRVGH